MSDRLVHVLFFGVFLEKGADEVRIYLFDGDDEIGGEEFGSVYQKERRRVVFFLDPKRDDVIPAVQTAVDPDAAVGEFDVRKVRRRLRQEAERYGRDYDEDAKERVVQNDGSERDGDGDDAERQKPIRAAFDVLMLVCAPAQCGAVWHVAILTPDDTH